MISALDSLTAKETAEYLKIPLPTVLYLLQRGQLPAARVNGRWRVKKALLDRDILRLPDGYARSDLITGLEAAEILGCSLPSVFYLMQHGHIASVQSGGTWRVIKSKIDPHIREY